MSTKQKKEPVKNIFKERTAANPLAPYDATIHKYGRDMRLCLTDSKGYPTPKNQDPTKIVIGYSEGFVGLWKKNMNLRWRFNPNIHNFFEYPYEVMDRIRDLMAEGIMEWGWTPIKFSENNDCWDFEIVVRPDNCNYYGCSLVRAFFPDSGRHELVLYPKLFSQSRKEQVETMAHEFGHIFGLRHFFANLAERELPSVIFGAHREISIMNYGEKSRMTKDDRNDLRNLYEQVWSGELLEINGTRIVTFYPYHFLGTTLAEFDLLRT